MEAPRPTDESVRPQGRDLSDGPPAALELAVRVLGAGSRGLTGFFGGLGLAAGISGVILWVVLLGVFESPGPWQLSLWIFLGLLLAAPGAVLVAFWAALRELARLPKRLAEVADSGSARVGAAYRSISAGAAPGGRLGRILVLMRSLVDLRSTLLQSRDLIAGSMLLVRMANPISLVIVLLAILLGCVLVPLGILVGAVAVF